MIWPFKRSIESRRKSALKHCSNPLMQDFLSADIADKNRDWRDISLVSLDLETTGLNPEKDQILSIGLVEIHHGSIHLDSAWHQIIQVENDIPEASAVIHHITDDIMAQGERIKSIIPQLLERLNGKVMLVHYANVEQNFLNAACQNLYGSPFIIQTIDTLKLAHRQMSARNHTIQTNDLRLFNLRKHYELPEYTAHNALYDAIATAELFMAMAAESNPKGPQRIGDYLN